MQLCVAARVEVAAFDQLWAKAAIGTGVLQIIDAAIIANNFRLIFIILALIISVVNDAEISSLAAISIASRIATTNMSSFISLDIKNVLALAAGTTPAYELRVACM